MAAKRQELPDIISQERQRLDVLGDVLSGKPQAQQAEQIPLDKIRADGGTQMRAQLDDPTVFEYTQAMIDAGSWGPFPPPVVFYDGSTYWLGDGFHRVAAFREAFNGASGLSVPCEVRAGDRRDAILYAAGANASHGLRRSNADKKRAVETMLRDEEWMGWSDNEIARRCNVSHPFVGGIRKSLSLVTVTSEKPAAAPPAERTYTTKHGTQASMKTGGIGKNKPMVVEAWQLERVVSGIPNLKASTLRTAARERKGHWLFDTAASRAQAEFPDAWNQTRLVQAMQNVAEQMEQRERQAPAAPPVSPEQRQYDMAVVPISVPAAAPARPRLHTTVEMPADLAQRGWEMRELASLGRWYCHNANGPRATQPYDHPADAIKAAYGMQVDLRSEPQPVAVMNAEPESDEAGAFRRAADAMDGAIKLLQLGSNYLVGYHDELRGAVDVVIDDVRTLIKELQ